MNSSSKKLIKIFIFLFVFSFIIINWNDVSWLFNYKALQGLSYDFFNPYPNTAGAIVIKNKNIVAGSSTDTVAAGASFEYFAGNNSIEIPDIKIYAPIVMAKSADNALVEKDLNNGVVYYPGSVLPGSNGHIVILGHSAPLNWPHIKYDWVFSKIDSLNSGDEIIMHFNNTKYVYRVTHKKIIQKGGDIEDAGLSGNNNILTLVSCWPPGKNYQRITVTAELVR